jgi:excinuclease ABC subunit A
MEGWGERKLRVRYTRSWGKITSRVEEELVWEGLVAIAEGWSAQTAWLRRERSCSACGGARLKPELLAVTLGDRPGAPPGFSISALCAMTVEAARDFWSALRLGPSEAAIAEQPLKDLLSRLSFLCDVGLGYLGLDRAAESLSGGEAQRIRLATQLGARLTGTTYVLDEPTVGLHPRDTQRLLGTLLGLRDLGNTLVVVEHDPEVIQAADHVVDLGPGAGEHGGRLIDQGSPAALKVGPGLTGQYLSGRRRVQRPAQRRSPRAWIELPPAHLHNLRGAVLRLPRGCFTAVTGVSGSGKSTLLLEHGVPWLVARKAGGTDFPGLVVVDQQPIGTTPRSTPATFCDLLGPIRELYASLPLSRERGWGPGRFSFNTPDGGRCAECEGRGATLVEMHFLSDVWVRCERCGGRRFDSSTLELRWKGHSIADALDLPVDEALELFRAQRKLARRLAALSDVGLGYVRLGQDGTTLSGGEAQRMKLANELVGRARETIYLLDEPTTGLHLADVDRLLSVLHRLVDQGHSVVVIEHHLDMIENADRVIELGPEGGAGGGQIVAQGSPEELARADTATGEALRRARAN